jgi:hypothetical protein
MFFVERPNSLCICLPPKLVAQTPIMDVGTSLSLWDILKGVGLPIARRDCLTVV